MLFTFNMHCLTFVTLTVQPSACLPTQPFRSRAFRLSTIDHKLHCCIKFGHRLHCKQHGKHHCAPCASMSTMYALYNAVSRSIVTPQNLALMACLSYMPFSSANSSHGAAPSDDSNIAGPAVLFLKIATLKKSNIAMTCVKMNEGLHRYMG